MEIHWTIGSFKTGSAAEISEKIFNAYLMLADDWKPALIFVRSLGVGSAVLDHLVALGLPAQRLTVSSCSL